MDDLIEAVGNAVDGTLDAIEEASRRGMHVEAREMFESGAQLLAVKAKLISQRDQRRFT